AAGPSGSVYVAGTDAAAHALVAKLDASSGAILWTATAGGGSSAGTALSVDGAGNAYATGNYTGTAAFGPTSLTSWSGTQDVFVWKLNAGGGPVWAGSIGSNGSDNSTGIALDGSGNAVVVGNWG